MFFLTSHYRSPLVFDEKTIKAQDKAISRLRSAFKIVSGDSNPLPTNQFKQDFMDAMDEDFNTPKALAVIFDLARDINREGSNGRDVSSAQKLLNELTQTLGINIENGKVLIECKKRYFRPVEVDYLKGNAQKAKKLLKWSPKISIDNLIDEMIEHELENL